MTFTLVGYTLGKRIDDPLDGGGGREEGWRVKGLVTKRGGRKKFRNKLTENFLDGEKSKTV